MDNFEEVVLAKLEDMEKRIIAMENQPNERQQKRNTKNYTVSPEDVEYGHMAFVGRYKSNDGLIGSTFGDSCIEIDKLFKCNSFEVARVIDAFSSEERIEIIKELINTTLSAKELMNRLKFQSTGKLYHHLSFLEKIGIIRKSGENFSVSAKYISCIILIFAGANKIISKNNEK